jgi:hypothetical protein
MAQKKKQVKTKGVSDSRESHGYLAPKPTEHEEAEILHSIEQYQKTPEHLKHDYEASKRIHYKEARAAEQISNLPKDQQPKAERKYFDYSDVKSPEPRENSVAHRTFLHLKKLGKEGVSKEDFTGYNLLTEQEKQLPKAEREKVQAHKVNKRGWGNAWANIRPLRGKARIDRLTRKVFYTEGE